MLIRDATARNDVQHYRLSAPPGTHRRVGDCLEAECSQYQFGWDTIVPDDSIQANYIRHVMNQGEPPENRRHFVEQREPDGMVRFRFHPGQRCFREHSVPTGRPATHLRAAGSAPPALLPGGMVIDGTRLHPEHEPWWGGHGRAVTEREWHESSGENLERLAEIRRRGV